MSYEQSRGEAAGLLSSKRMKTGWMIKLQLWAVSLDVLTSMQDIMWDQGQFKASQSLWLHGLLQFCGSWNGWLSYRFYTKHLLI